MSSQGSKGWATNCEMGCRAKTSISTIYTQDLTGWPAKCWMRWKANISVRSTVHTLNITGTHKTGCSGGTILESGTYLAQHELESI